MELKECLRGKPVALPEMLDARERRAARQQRLLAAYRLPLISFTLNIAGPYKVFPLAVKTYEEGVELISCQCKTHGIVLCHTEEVREPTGYECCFVAKAPAEAIKRALASLEQTSTLGRLFDIDVLDAGGRKLSRTELGLPKRRCLICDEPAFVCSRSRSHTVEALQQRTVSIMWDYFAERYAALVASAACRALLYEVLATPKPGLVDKQNTGAHRDMDIVTFESSALALLPYLKAFVSYGIAHCDAAPETLLAALRPIGLDAEFAMLRATRGVNTHKGIIFSLGILEAALGMLYGRGETADRAALRPLMQQIAAPMVRDFDGLTAETAVTNGEKLFVAHGVRGVRGEAADGFPALFEVALPRMDALLAANFSQNDAGVLTLLEILAQTQDTNLIARSSYAEMERIRGALRGQLAGGIGRQEALALAARMDEEFIAAGISPGGSADLLALTYFVEFLEQDGLMQPRGQSGQ